MSSYDPSLFNTNPYYDDFSEDKKFLRMLFRPGYSVQSRELTQLQTILQNQIERFGNHIFKDGSRIIGGEISTQTLDFIRLEKNTYASPVFGVGESDIVGYNLIRRGSTGDVDIKAKVIDFVPSAGQGNDDYGIAVVSYLSGQGFSAGSTLECDNPNRVVNLRVPATLPSGNTHAGRCKVVGVNEGIYFINGFFVKGTNQFEPAYTTNANGIRNFVSPTGSMGFQIAQTIVTEREDYTLKDPASGSYNYNAPGAHRFKIDPILKFVESISGEDFIELVRYENGIITKKNDESAYSELVNLFAQRTYDESGNYIVKPFDISFRDGSGSTFFADIGSGKAYVFGYEYETKFKDVVPISTARTTKTYSDLLALNYFGNYVKGIYQPSLNQTLVNPLFTGLNSSLGEQTRGYFVYGATGPIDGFTLDNALFTGYLVGFDFDSDEIKTTTEVNTSLDMVYHLMGVQYNPNTTINLTSGTINLYALDRRTNVSTKIGHNLERNLLFAGLSLASQYAFDSENQSLVYEANQSAPTTLIKSIEEIEYIHTVYKAFTSTTTNSQPRVFLSQGVEFNWCLANGTVPSGTAINIDERDGFYVVYASGNALPIGTIIKIVSAGYIVQPGSTKITAQITGDGDAVKFTSNLPVGGYYLVGKSKNTSNDIDETTDPTAKIRTKTSDTRSETITNITSTINTYKRVINKNSSNSIYEMYFVLDRADVWKINSITQNGLDVTDRFLFDTGQRDSEYQLARLYVKPEYFDTYSGAANFSLVINYSYFIHSGYGPFTVESYRNGITYSEIPIFVSPSTGKSIHLANALDFRFVAQIEGFRTSGSTAGTFSSGATGEALYPVITYSNGFSPMKFTAKSTHNAYLPRIDKLVVSRNISSEGETTTLQRVSGNPSDSPIIPEDLRDSMTLFVLSIPAYTFKATDVKAERIGNSRFTMKDIGDISRRVGNLEQYTVLTDLELDIIGRSLKTTSGEDAIKKAILVDSFDGHSVADVANRDHQCSIDVERGELRPSFSSDSYGFKYIGSFNGLTLTTDGILCHDFGKFNTPVVSQQNASEYIKVNPFDLPNWVGHIVLTPHGDYWYDNTTRPLVKNNDNGINDAWLSSNANDSFGHGTQWNDWESLWSGISVELTDAESKKNSAFFSKPRRGQTPNIVGDRFVVTEGIERTTPSIEKLKDKYTSNFRNKDFYDEVAMNTILNKSVVPMMRSKSISFSAYNLKPNTTVSIFFDNVNVNNRCTKLGATGPFKTGTLDGSLTNITFAIPDETFEVGDKILRIIDNADNNIDDATTIAEAVFHASGIKTDDFSNVVSIRPVEVRKLSPNSNKIVSNPLFRDKSINTAIFNQWIDPLTQTFEINQNFYPNGLYLESVDLFIATKDSSLPISIEIHPVVNGLPHSSFVLPFSTVVKNPSGITADANTPTATNFKFSTPVYLAPGQYALAIKANSSDYSVFVANVGQNDIRSNERISSTFNGGILFKPQNSAQAVGDSSTDLMFNLNRCVFRTAPTTITLVHDHTEDNDVTLIQPNPYVFVPPGVFVDTKVKISTNGDTPDSYDAIFSRNLQLSKVYELDSDETLNIDLSSKITSAGVLTPMIDMDKTNVVVVNNIIDSSDSTTQETSPFAGRPNSKVARYITKEVNLPVGELARELKVIFDANVPTESFIKVYGKTFAKSGQSGYSSNAYEIMNSESVNFEVGGTETNSLTTFDFREMSYSLAPSASFDSFAIKIVMYSAKPNKVPVIKNLKVVAVE